MMNRKLPGQECSPPDAGRGLALAAGALVLLLAAISCETVNRAVVVLPDVPGAKYIGSKECEQCHDKLTGLRHGGPRAADRRGDQRAQRRVRILPRPVQPPLGVRRRNEASLQFHRRPPPDQQLRRAVAGRAGPRARKRSASNAIPTCAASSDLPSHHPVPEGRLTCTACHSPHKGSIHIGGGTSLLSENDICFRCHAAQRGPYVFEHEALREGCTTCHTAHGSVNAKLLNVRDANLCLKCHFQQVSSGQLLIGGSDHTLRVQQGTCWTAGCHEAVHGSRVSPSLRF